jgi:hypothetical protein
MLTNRREPISGEAVSARSAVTKRAVVLAGVAAIEIVMAVVLIPSTDHARIETTDFLNFHVGATIVREGQGRSLYQAETQQLVPLLFAEYVGTAGFRISSSDCESDARAGLHSGAILHQCGVPPWRKKTRLRGQD